MGAGVSAAHLIVFIAVASAGTILVGAASDTWRKNSQAQAEAVDRLKEAANEKLELTSSGFLPVRCVNDGPGQGCQGTIDTSHTWANVTNNGSQEIRLEDVTVLLNGTHTDTSTLDVFQVRGATTSDLWLPGEVLEIRIDGQGDVDVTVIGPHGVKAYRRN